MFSAWFGGFGQAGRHALSGPGFRLLLSCLHYIRWCRNFGNEAGHPLSFLRCQQSFRRIALRAAKEGLAEFLRRRVMMLAYRPETPENQLRPLRAENTANGNGLEGEGCIKRRRNFGSCDAA